MAHRYKIKRVLILLLMYSPMTLFSLRDNLNLDLYQHSKNLCSGAIPTASLVN